MTQVSLSNAILASWFGALAFGEEVNDLSLAKGRIVTIFGILHTKNWKLSVLIIGNRSPWFHIQSFIWPDCSHWWNCPSEPRSELKFLKCFLQTGSGSCPEVSLECKEEGLNSRLFSRLCCLLKDNTIKPFPIIWVRKSRVFSPQGWVRFPPHTSDFLFTLSASQMSYFGGLGLEQSLKKNPFPGFCVEGLRKKTPQNNTKTNQR